MFTKNDFESVLNSLEFYNNRLIYVIKDGKDTVVNDLYNTFNKYVEGIKEDIALATTIKVQGLEIYNSQILDKCYQLYQKWQKPVDCHAYWGYANNGSFEMHEDPYEVYIEVMEGNKKINIDGVETELKSGDSIIIPARVPHKAFNTTDCLSLSFSSFDFSGQSMNVGIKL
jgi:mannose-6-phosphate isomerase-like protein (cupin superfamily)